jgi:hypothetical protein
MATAKKAKKAAKKSAKKSSKKSAKKKSSGGRVVRKAKAGNGWPDLD